MYTHKHKQNKTGEKIMTISTLSFATGHVTLAVVYNYLPITSLLYFIHLQPISQ